MMTRRDFLAMARVIADALMQTRNQNEVEIVWTIFLGFMNTARDSNPRFSEDAFAGAVAEELRKQSAHAPLHEFNRMTFNSVRFFKTF